MKSATTMYLAMILGCVLGLWAIMHLGRNLQAPPDLRGQWEIVDMNMQETAGCLEKVSIEQSGQFAQVKWGDNAPKATRLAVQSGSDPAISIRLTDDAGALLLISEGGATRGRGAWRLKGGLWDGKVMRQAVASDDARESTGADEAATDAATKEGHMLYTLLLAVACIVAASQGLGMVFRRFGQPRVVGEMVAGLALGPSLMGWLLPGVSHSVFPSEALPYLGMLSQVGVIFFLFLVGLELDPRLLKSRGHAAVVISHASIVAPFLLGGLSALLLFPRLFNDTETMRFSSVALFMSAAMSITAFPVLARILTEQKLHKTQIGAVAITCAAVDDVTAWCLLAFVVGVVRAEAVTSAVMTALWSAGFIAFMFLIAKPLLSRLERIVERKGMVPARVMAVVILATLLGSAATEAIGIHALFGAFLTGAVMPKGEKFVNQLRDKIEDFTVTLLLPIFFAYTGLRTQIGLIDTGELWLWTALIIFVACLGKFGGSSLLARMCGMSWREAGAIGILMNTRGLMELVILNIGRELGVITDAIFAMMVLMAIVTTFMTTPVLALVYPRRLRKQAHEHADEPIVDVIDRAASAVHAD